MSIQLKITTNHLKCRNRDRSYKTKLYKPKLHLQRTFYKMDDLVPEQK